MNVLTIGGAMLDTIITIASDRIEQMQMRNAESSFLLLEEGLKTDAEQIVAQCGGGAVNAAVAMARLGYQTAIIAKVGNDDKAKTLLGRLSNEGVDVRWISVDSREPTGASVIISSHDRNAAVFTYRGANTRLSAEDLANDAFADKDLVYVANLSNESADHYPLVIARAKAAGAKLAVNPGVRQLTARFDDFWNSLNQIDILSINRREAQTFMPRLLQAFGEGGAALSVKSGEPIPALAKRGLRNGGYEMSLLKFLGSLVELGVGAVVLTDGANGSFIAIGHDLYYREAETVTAAATTGAGDAFTATFACYFADTGNVARSLAAAVLNAANVVRYVDTQTGLLTRQAMEKELERATGHPLYTWSI